MGEHPQLITQFLDSVFSHGAGWVYLAILGACFIENLFPPFPGDSFIVAAGSLVALNRLDFSLAFLLVVAGGVSSMMLVYLVGKNYGRDYFIRKNYKYFSAADIQAVENHFQKWGALILVFSRFIVGMRTVIALVAGIGRYQPVKMLVYSVISYVIFTGLLFYLAITLVENLERIEYYFKTYNLAVWIVIGGLLVGYIGYKIRRAKKKGL